MHNTGRELKDCYFFLTKKETPYKLFTPNLLLSIFFKWIILFSLYSVIYYNTFQASVGVLLNKKCKGTEVLAERLGTSDKKVSIYYFDCGFLQGVEILLRVLISTKLLKISIIWKK